MQFEECQKRSVPYELENMKKGFERPPGLRGRTFIGMAALLSVALASPSHGAEGNVFQPSQKERCPVCGMFVAPYPHFLATIEFEDGTQAYFDGPKDLFRYYFGMKKYDPSRKVDDIKNIHVTDYYSLSPVDGVKAYFVTGSDVYGPMGHELIPIAKEAEASNFLIDHSGKSLLRFEDITPDVIKLLD